MRIIRNWSLEAEGKFGDCVKLVTDRDSENRATHDLVA
jgi:hypothetical protein